MLKTGAPLGELVIDLTPNSDDETEEEIFACLLFYFAAHLLRRETL